MTASTTRRPSPYLLVTAALERYEEARSGAHVYVSELAARFSRGRGRGVEAGRRLHSSLWGFDPYDVLEYEELCTPFPLAWRFRFGWLLGVPDRLCFKHGVPHAVIEYKSYGTARKAEKIQAALYALLATINFATPIQAYVHTIDQLVKVKDWKMYALEGMKTAAANIKIAVQKS